MKKRILLIKAIQPVVIALVILGAVFAVFYVSKNVVSAECKMAVVEGQPDVDYSAVSRLATARTSTVRKVPIKAREAFVPSVGKQYGVIRIGTIDLEVPLYFGDSQDILESGAGQYEGSSLPGHKSEILIGGHDLTWFRDLDKVKTDDSVTIDTVYGRYEYKVTDTHAYDAADPAAYDIDRKGERLVLYTCYPLGDILSTRAKRLFVYCEKTAGADVEGVADEQ